MATEKLWAEAPVATLQRRQKSASRTSWRSGAQSACTARPSEEPPSWWGVHHPPPAWKHQEQHGGEHQGTRSGPEALQFWLKDQKRGPRVLRAQSTFSSRPCPLTLQTPRDPEATHNMSVGEPKRWAGGSLLQAVKLQSRQHGAKPLHFLLSVTSLSSGPDKGTVVTYSKGRCLKPHCSGQRTKNENSQGRRSLKWPHQTPDVCDRSTNRDRRSGLGDRREWRRRGCENGTDTGATEGRLGPGGWI